MLYALNGTRRVNTVISDESLDKELRIDGAKKEKVFGFFIFRSEKESILKKIVVEGFDGMDVEIFSVRPVKVLQPSCSFGMKGDIPEIMLPVEYAIANGETNKLKAGSNNVFALSLIVPFNTDAGKKSGRVVFYTVDDKYELPIEIEVFGFSLPEENHSRGMFSVWYENDFGKDGYYHGEEYAEYYETYELLKKYRVSATELPVRSATNKKFCAASEGKIFAFEPMRYISEDDTDNYIEAASAATKDKKVASYLIPYSVIKEEDGYYGIDKTKLKNLLSRLADESSRDCDLFKKAYVHVTAIDEPTQKMFPSVRKITKDIRECISYVAENCDFCGKENVKISLLKLDNVVTAWPEEQLFGGVDTWCPTFQGWHSFDFIRGMKRMYSLGYKSWWYGCICPWYPFPNYHLDEPLLGARIEGFLRYYYNIGGNLYWSVNADRFRGEHNTVEEIDIFKGTDRWKQASGDGSLIFRGKYFGLNGYLATLRLAAICQGNQDYEYCFLLNEKLSEFCKKYDLNIKAEEIIAPAFGRAFYKTAVLTEEGFYSLRREIAAAIELLDKGIVFINGGVCSDLQKAEILCYSAGNEEIISDSGQIRENHCGLKVYRYSVKLQKDRDTYFDADIQSDGYYYHYRRFVSEAVKKLKTERIKVTRNITVKKVGATKVYRTEEFTNSECPEIVYEGNFDLRKINDFILRINSMCDYSFNVSIVIFDVSGKSFMVDYACVEKGDNNLRLHFNPTMQLNAYKEIRHVSGFSHYDDELRSLNNINLEKIKRITVQIHNEKEYCGYFPRELHHEKYVFSIEEFYYGIWEKNPHNYKFLTESKND